MRWPRRSLHGHDGGRLPEATRPFVKKGRKNDAADAAAILAASRHDVKFVPVKSREQQATLALHSARTLLVKQRTMLVNAMRGLATEFGSRSLFPMTRRATFPRSSMSSSRSKPRFLKFRPEPRSAMGSQPSQPFFAACAKSLAFCRSRSDFWSEHETRA